MDCSISVISWFVTMLMNPVGLLRALANEAKVKWAVFSQATCWSVATSLTLHSHGRTWLLLIIRPEFRLVLSPFLDKQITVWTGSQEFQSFLQRGIPFSKACFSFTRVKLIETVLQFTVDIRGTWKGRTQLECSYSIKMISAHRIFGSTYTSSWDTWVFI